MDTIILIATIYCLDSGGLTLGAPPSRPADAGSTHRPAW